MEDEYYDSGTPNYSINIGFDGWFHFSVTILILYLAIKMSYKTGEILRRSNYTFSGKGIKGAMSAVWNFAVCCGAGSFIAFFVYMFIPFIEKPPAPEEWYFSPIFDLAVYFGYLGVKAKNEDPDDKS